MVEGADSPSAKATSLFLAKTHNERAEHHTNSAIADIEKSTINGRHAAAWRALNTLIGRKANPVTVIAAAAKSIEERKSAIANHYKTVLNAPASPEPPE
jgi:hypothetical protein